MSITTQQTQWRPHFSWNLISTTVLLSIHSLHPNQPKSVCLLSCAAVQTTLTQTENYIHTHAYTQIRSVCLYVNWMEPQRIYSRSILYVLTHKLWAHTHTHSQILVKDYNQCVMQSRCEVRPSYGMCGLSSLELAHRKGAVILGSCAIMRRTVVFLQTEGEEKQGGGGRRRRRGTGTLLQMNHSEGSMLWMICQFLTRSSLFVCSESILWIPCSLLHLNLWMSGWKTPWLTMVSRNSTTNAEGFLTSLFLRPSS